MAAEHAHHDYHRGEMDIHEQSHTYALFLKMVKWGSLATAVIMLMLTIWFGTPGGFMGGLFTAVVVSVIGVLVLREKRRAH